MKKYLITTSFLRDGQILEVPSETTQDELEKMVELANNEDEDFYDEGYGWVSFGNLSAFIGIVEARNKEDALSIASRGYQLSKVILDAEELK